MYIIYCVKIIFLRNKDNEGLQNIRNDLFRRVDSRNYIACLLLVRCETSPLSIGK